jgi:peptide/nickel transport system ATP-binding protein
MTLLHVKNLTISHQEKTLVKDISFEIEKGKTTCIIGESGSGKSLTALAIMGLLPPALTMHGDARFEKASIIFQEPLTALNPVIRIGKQIEEVFIIRGGFSKKERREKVISLLKKVRLPNPENIINAYPSQISGGQRQRVMIAIALAMKPQLLIADEPTTALDVTTQKEILALLNAIQKETGMAILFITHDFTVAENIAENVLVMHQGKLVEQGKLKIIFKSPKQDYTKKLLEATPKLNTAKKPLKKTKPLLKVEKLSNTFTVHQKHALSLFPKKMLMLQNISFTLHQGETVGVVGESGCGKSTLSRCILDLYHPTEGKVIFEGEQHDIAHRRRFIQMVFQDPFSSLNPRMVIGDSIAEGMRAHQLYPETEIRSRVETLLEQCYLPKNSFDKYPHHFSGGQRQRICIARALAMNPKIIIADEAVSALDVSIQKQVLELMEELKHQHNLSYLFISHDLRVISQISDKVLVMHKGEIVEHGSVNQIFTKPKHAYTKKLLSSATA